MFSGFTDETVDFMWGIRFNNEKPWFEAHKGEYIGSLYNPMKELSQELYGWFRERRPELPLVHRVARIYRDARRLHGGGPYKDHLWLCVEGPSESAWDTKPTFWFELTPESWSYGMGYYMATPLTMLKLRTRMDRDSGPMETLTRRLNRQSEFILEGDEYKKPKGEPSSPLLAPWYRKKGFSIIHEQKLDETPFSRALVDRLEAGYAFLLPYYEYLSTLDADPDPRD